MTDSNLPPEGSAAARLRAAARAVDNSSLRSRAAERLDQKGRAPEKTDLRLRLGDKTEQKARTAAKPLTGGPERQSNGARAAAPTPLVRQRAPSIPATARNGAPVQPAPVRAVSRALAAPPEPNPQPPQRAVRAVRALDPEPIPVQRADGKRLTPRSPRTALEPDKVEIPTRRSKRARHPVVIVGNAVISLFLILMVAAGYVLYVGKQRFEAPGPLTEDRTVTIPHRAGVREISDALMREGVIDQPWVFIGGVMLLKAREGLKAGEYEFKAHASLRDVVSTLIDGKVVMHQVSIPEGLTSEQIVAKLMDDDVLTGNITEIPAEGSMLPDTYNFSRGTTREQMIARMQQAQQRLLKDIWSRRVPDLPLRTPAQLVILASMVEKETGKPEERTRIAAVFVNRLKQKMRLQSDPTIIYGLVGGKGSLGRPIKKSEIDEPTPYNTYQIDGLPPGPITNPGRAALEAAANPARTRDLYFVADGTGGHVFSETYEQHQKNVLKLRQIEAAAQKEQNPPGGETPAPAQAATPAPAHHALRRRTRPVQ